MILLQKEMLLLVVQGSKWGKDKAKEYPVQISAMAMTTGKAGELQEESGGKGAGAQNMQKRKGQLWFGKHMPYLSCKITIIPSYFVLLKSGTISIFGVSILSNHNQSRFEPKLIFHFIEGLLHFSNLGNALLDFKFLSKWHSLASTLGPRMPLGPGSRENKNHGGWQLYLQVGYLGRPETETKGTWDGRQQSKDRR